MELARSLPENTWRCFVDEHPGGNIFHTPEMFQVFAEAKCHDPSLWAVVDEDQRPLALLLPVHVDLFGGQLPQFTTRAVVYGSVLAEPSPQGEQALAILLDEYDRRTSNDVLFTELRNLSDLAPIQPILEKHGFVYEDHLNYLIDLDRSPESILQGISRSTRKRIRRGIRRGDVAISEVQDRAQIAGLYYLLKKSYRAANVPLADISLFYAAFDVLRNKDMVRFTMAEIDGANVACSVELYYGNDVFGWYGGVDRGYSAYTPSELLTWHILEWSAVNGYRLYDFGGAGKPDEEYGVRDFKAKFGGDLVCFGRNIHVPSRIRLGISKAGYELNRLMARITQRAAAE